MSEINPNNPYSSSLFTPLCNTCSATCTKLYIIRLYPSKIDLSMSFDMLPLYSATLYMQIQGDSAHAMAAQGNISLDNISDMNDILKNRGVNSVIWERHTTNGLKNVKRYIK